MLQFAGLVGNRLCLTVSRNRAFMSRIIIVDADALAFDQEHIRNSNWILKC